MLILDKNVGNSPFLIKSLNASIPFKDKLLITSLILVSLSNIKKSLF